MLGNDMNKERGSAILTEPMWGGLCLALVAKLSQSDEGLDEKEYVRRSSFPVQEGNPPFRGLGGMTLVNVVSRSTFQIAWGRHV